MDEARSTHGRDKSCKVLVAKNLKEKDNSKDVDIDYNKYGVCGPDQFGLGQGPVAVSSHHWVRKTILE